METGVKHCASLYSSLICEVEGCLNQEPLSLSKGSLFLIAKFAFLLSSIGILA